MIRRLAQRGTLLTAVAIAAVVTFAAGVALAAWKETTQLSATATAGYVQPVVSRVPHIAGAAAQGETLTAQAALWTGISPSATRAYQWSACTATLASCTAIGGATGTTYTVPTDGVDTRRYVVRETVTNGTRTATAVSIPTEPQAPGSALGLAGLTLFKFITVTTTMPTVTGTPTTGSSLSTSIGTWSTRSLVGALLGTVFSSDTYKWLRCGPVGNTGNPTVGAAGCDVIPGATSATYTPGPADLGQRLRAQVAHHGSIGVTVLGLPVTVPFTGTVDTQATAVVTAP